MTSTATVMPAVIAVIIFQVDEQGCKIDVMKFWVVAKATDIVIPIKPIVKTGATQVDTIAIATQTASTEDLKIPKETLFGCPRFVSKVDGIGQY